MPLRTIISRGIIIFFACIFVGYGLLEARGLMLGPRITLASPDEGAAFKEPLILVQGQALRAKDLSVNGAKVLIDLSGNFSEHLVLTPGYNIMTIIATDARGKQHTLTRHLYYTAPIPTSTPEANDSSVYGIINQADGTTTILASSTATDTSE